MRNCCLLSLAIVAIAVLSGCSLITVSTNIPIFNGSGTVIEVVNSSDYPMTLSVNGEAQQFCFSNGCVSSSLQPGASATIRLRNWGNDTKETVIVAKAWDCKHCLVGVATYGSWVSPQYYHTDAWVLRNGDFCR